MICRTCGRRIKKTAEWCPYCGEYTEEGAIVHEQEKERIERDQRNIENQIRSQKQEELVRNKINSVFYVSIVGFIVVILFFFWNGVLTSQNGKDKVLKYEDSKVTKTVENNALRIASKEQTKEMMSSFNGIIGDNNPELYRGIQIFGSANHGQIILYVSQKWYYLPKGIKEEFLKSSAMLWVGMMGARKIEVDANKITFAIRREDSKEDLATWDSFWGPIIKK